ncbi:MAG: hypothetical protein R3B45_04525 [Bdellovibrionota bacterium]
MKFYFPESDTEKIVKSLKKALSGRKLGKMVDFNNEATKIRVTISKLGTSNIDFKQTPAKDGVEWTLTSEKIAFSHKAFKDEVIEKINKIIESVGGTVL